MPTNATINLDEFEEIVRPIVALLSFYSNDLFSFDPESLVLLPSRKPEPAVFQVRYFMARNFFHQETPLDPYIIALLRINHEDQTIRFRIDHDASISFDRSFTRCELVVSGSSGTSRGAYKAAAMKFLRHVAEGHELHDQDREELRVFRAAHKDSIVE